MEISVEQKDYIQMLLKVTAIVPYLNNYMYRLPSRLHAGK